MVHLVEDLDDLNIPYELIMDEDNVFHIFIHDDYSRKVRTVLNAYTDEYEETYSDDFDYDGKMFFTVYMDNDNGIL